MVNSQYMRCPYCGIPGKMGQRVPRSVGVFKIKELYDNTLIFKCVRCRKICRRKTVGSILRWEDMSDAERKIFNTEVYSDYKTKSKEVKNDKKI